jgi:hypothetical protein
MTHYHNRQYDQRYSAERRYQLRLAGMCESCGKVRVERYGKCADCLERHRQSKMRKGGHNGLSPTYH